MSDSAKDYHLWLLKAGNDMLNIENNLSSVEIPWDTLCFHAHEATQKTLKAFLVFNDQMPGDSEGTLALFNRCIPFAPALGDLENQCKKIDAYAMIHASPQMEKEPLEEEVLSVISVAGEIQSRIMNLIE